MTNVNYKDCNQQNSGTGVFSCEVPSGIPVGFIKTTRNWELDPATETYNAAYIKQKIQEGVFEPFLDAVDFAQAKTDSQYSTTSTGNQIKNASGKPGLDFIYSKDYNFHKAAYQRNSFRGGRVIVIYDNGVHFVAQKSDGKLRGHNLGLFDTMGFEEQSGQDYQKTVVQLRFLDDREWNLGGAHLDPVANSFDSDEIPEVFDVNITKVSNSTTDVVFTVTAASNGATSITGVTDSLLAVTGTAVALSSVAYNASTKQYTATFASDVSGDYANIEFTLNDGTYTIVDISDTLYKGSSS